MEQTLNKALRYVLQNVHCFDVPKLEIEIEQLKPFFELVFFYNMLPPHIQAQEQWQQIKNYIFSQIECNDFATKLTHNIEILSGVAILEQFLLLHECSKYHTILTQVVAEQEGLLDKRLPFRQLDMKYSLQQAQILDNFPTFEAIYAMTVLGKTATPFYLTWMLMYSMTHTIFYLTDMGRNKKYSTLLADKGELMQHLLTENIINNDLDILGEVIMSCFFLELADDMTIRPLLTYAMSFICQHQFVDGAFPAPSEHTQRVAKGATFQLRYHTTLVCIGALLWYIEKM